MNEEYKVVELGDGTKWFIAGETDYNNETYQYLIETDNAEEDFLDNYMVVKHYITDNQDCFEVIEDKELLKEIVPILMPEAKPYIDDPNKINELIES